MTEPKNMTQLVQRLEMDLEKSRRHLSHWAESHFLKQTTLAMKVGEKLRARVQAIRAELTLLARTAEDLSRKLEPIAAGAPELVKEAPAGEVKAQSMKKPS